MQIYSNNACANGSETNITPISTETPVVAPAGSKGVRQQLCNLSVATQYQGSTHDTSLAANLVNFFNIGSHCTPVSLSSDSCAPQNQITSGRNQLTTLGGIGDIRRSSEDSSLEEHLSSNVVISEPDNLETGNNMNLEKNMDIENVTYKTAVSLATAGNLFQEDLEELVHPMVPSTTVVKYPIPSIKLEALADCRAE